MAHLQYYAKENEELGTYRQAKLTNQEVEFIYAKFQRRFRLNQTLEFYGYRDSGNCSRRRIRLSNNPSILVLAHEVAHAIQFRKLYEKYFPGAIPAHKWHTKRHARLTRKFCVLISEKLPVYKDAIAIKEGKRVAIEQRKAERMACVQAEKASPAYKLKKVEEKLAKWNSKLKRASTAIKKLERQRRNLMKKVI